jgi:hypothetical protein
MLTPGGQARRCPFCFPARIAPAQLLVSTEHFYLLAPAGQVVEGFLCIMTHACRDAPTRLRCVDDIPAAAVPELRALQQLVEDFYHDVYRVPPIFYENGRGGGRESSFPGGDFAFHPHLCALPGPLIVHEPLQARFRWHAAGDYPSVRQRIGTRPYLYVDTPSDEAYHRPVVYYSLDESGDGDLIRVSLKELLVEANSLGVAVNWRTHPGQAEMARLISRFGRWYSSVFEW